MNIYEKIQTLCRKNGFEISSLPEKIPELKITRGSLTGWKNGAMPRANKIKLIADYFNVDTDYFYENNKVGNNNNIVSNCDNSTVNIGSLNQYSIGEIEKELLNICSKLDIKRKTALLTKAYELLENWEVFIWI